MDGEGVWVGVCVLGWNIDLCSMYNAERHLQTPIAPLRCKAGEIRDEWMNYGVYKMERVSSPHSKIPFFTNKAEADFFFQVMT